MTGGGIVGSGYDVEYNAGTLTGQFNVNVTAEDNPLVYNSTSVQLLPGPVASIACQQWPNQAFTVGTTGHPFNITGHDQFGNENWTWAVNWTNVTGGSLTPIGYNASYSAGTAAGDFNMNVTVDGNPSVFNHTLVTLLPGPVSHIDCTQWPSQIHTVDTNHPFNVTGYDQFWNENTTWVANWSKVTGGVIVGSGLDVIYSAGTLAGSFQAPKPVALQDRRDGRRAGGNQEAHRPPAPVHAQHQGHRRGRGGVEEGPAGMQGEQVM